MALFNVPVRYGDHVARSVAAAIELQLAVPRIGAETGSEGPLHIGVGISTGFGLVGRLGSNHPSDYTAIGEVVNLAARLQAQAGPGEVLVTEDVYAVVSEAFSHAPRRALNLKGFPTPVPAYALT